jgi:hypothetical protein
MTSRQSCEGGVVAGAVVAGGAGVLSPAVEAGVAVAVGCDWGAAVVVPEAVEGAAAAPWDRVADDAVDGTGTRGSRRDAGVATGAPAVCSRGAFAVAAERAEGVRSGAR